MRKISLLFYALVCATMTAWAVDWSTVEWLGNGVGEGYSEKYKAVVSPAFDAPGFINNLQIKNDVPSIHVCFPSAAFGAFSLNEGQYFTEGAGAFFHLDAFTAQETEFTVVCADITYTFTVFYVDGETSGGTPENLLQPVVANKARKEIRNGQIVIIKNGIRYNALGVEMK